MLQIRRMTHADVPLGMRLVEEAGWNQTANDWGRFLAMEPEGCFVAEWDGRPVATATACRLGSVAWIAAVLVEAALRGRGIGTRMVQHALAYLDDRGIQTVRLDATALGRPIYERLGFSTQSRVARFVGVARPGGFYDYVRTVSAEHFAAILDLDRLATGTDRRRLIEGLCHQEPGRLRAYYAPDGVLGYLMWRRGRLAIQLGPAVAASPEVGIALLETAMTDCQGELVYVDILAENAPAIAWAESRGLAIQREFDRMCRGVPVRDRVDLLWASSGPEHG